MKFKPFLKCRAASSTDARILMRYAVETPSGTRGRIVEEVAKGRLDADRGDVLLDALVHERALYDTAAMGGEVDIPKRGWHCLGNGARQRRARL